jgi:hypothetical protein
MRLLLSSAVPQLSPTRPPLCSLLWNSISHHNNGITSPFSTTAGVVSLQDIDHTLRVVIQLTDGGAELSDMKNLLRSKDTSSSGKKTKRNKKNGSEEVESLPINDEDVANALLKLECLCEVDILPSHITWCLNLILCCSSGSGAQSLHPLMRRGKSVKLREKSTLFELKSTR